MALITSDCDAMRSPSIKWPQSRRIVRSGSATGLPDAYMGATMYPRETLPFLALLLQFRQRLTPFARGAAAGRGPTRSTPPYGRKSWPTWSRSTTTTCSGGSTRSTRPTPPLAPEPLMLAVGGLRGPCLCARLYLCVCVAVIIVCAPPPTAQPPPPLMHGLQSRNPGPPTGRCLYGCVVCTQLTPRPSRLWAPKVGSSRLLGRLIATGSHPPKARPRFDRHPAHVLQQRRHTVRVRSHAARDVTATGHSPAIRRARLVLVPAVLRWTRPRHQRVGRWQQKRRGKASGAAAAAAAVEAH